MLDEMPVVFVDLRRARGAVKEWFDAPHLSRQTGALFSSGQTMTGPHEIG